MSSKVVSPNGFGTLYMVKGSYQRVAVQDSHDIVSQILKSYRVNHYTNKDVIALNDEGSDECDIQVIFSHDNMAMGLITLRR